MDFFHYQQGQLIAEQVAVADIAARWGTPIYIYSRAALEQHWSQFDSALSTRSHLICYAVKANSNLAVLQVLAKLGSGFDIVSQGELERVLAAGGLPQRIIFSGVGKLQTEIERALAVGIRCFNVESSAELFRLNQIAQAMGKTANIALRVNPDINAGTHPYIATGLKENKFGIPIDQAFTLYEEASRLEHIQITGIACHIGSQLLDLKPFAAAFKRVYDVVLALAAKNIHLQHVDLGGGLGIRYQQEELPSLTEYARIIDDTIPNQNLQIILEPGRAIAGNAGLLVTHVEYLKEAEAKNFAVVDAGMNDLIRPSLYGAVQAIAPVRLPSGNEVKTYDVVGPVCETGDFLGKDRQLALAVGDLLAIHGAGAYGFTMSSNYNTRPRAAEVLVEGNQCYLVRPRETLASLFATENLLM